VKITFQLGAERENKLSFVVGRRRRWVTQEYAGVAQQIFSWGILNQFQLKSSNGIFPIAAGQANGLPQWNPRTYW
jgi:hypothetical protein